MISEVHLKQKKTTIFETSLFAYVLQKGCYAYMGYYAMILIKKVTTLITFVCG